MVIGNNEVLIYSEDPLGMLKHIITVFGITSVSPAIEVKTDIHEITSIGSQAVVEKINRGNTFNVRVRGKFKNLSFTSRDAEVCLSAEILLRTEEVGIENVRTSLRKPNIRVFVDVKGRKSHIYFEKYKGIGGLPYGIRGRALSIISRDIKSAVSTWITAREGYVIVPVQFSLNQYASKEYRAKVTNTLRKLREYIPEEKLKVYLFNHTYSIRKLSEEVPREMICTACRIIMYKVTEKLCKEIKANGIIVYEDQYIPYKTNLSAINEFIRVPIFRPLNSLNKHRIKEIAKKIGLNDDWKIWKCALAPEYTIEVDFKTIMKILKDINWMSIVNREYETLIIRELK